MCYLKLGELSGKNLIDLENPNDILTIKKK